MTIGIHFAARSDVGMLREGNEDSAYAGSRLLAVADGMGGHVGGEIASAAAIETIKRLDVDVPANELLAALDHAVQQANQKLHSIVEKDPALQGMGTTLTAMLWNGSQLALVHIGDSRAYLLRNGELFQITHDHTLVQSLVDEGRISLDEAASHPQRSLLLRALDGRSEVEPDLQLREAQVGDRYLLCSDGLSTVVTAETIHHAMSTLAEPEQVVRQLIDLANRGGGPDNITCVVADVIELESTNWAPDGPIIAGAAQSARQPQAEPPGAMAGDSPAHRAAAIRETRPQPAVALDTPPPPQAEVQPQIAPQRLRRRWTWLIAVVGVFILLVAGGAYFGYRTVQDQYYVAPDGGSVAIYQGMHGKVLGFNMSKLKQKSDLLISDLTPSAQHDVNTVISGLGSFGKAQQVVTNLRARTCKTTVSDDDTGNVVVWKGRNQSDCSAVVLFRPPAPVKLGLLPAADQTAVRAGIPVANLAAAQGEVSKLQDHATACAAHPALSGCPAKAR
jgi:PPM family protein phosphatase